MVKKVLIVGAVAGGASAAARLRRLDESAEIIMFERGEYISFANCGLPYYIGGAITDKEKLTLQTPQSFNARFNVDVRINSEVTAIDGRSKTVTVRNTKTGESYTESYDKLVLAPGAEPVKPDIKRQNVFTLRNIPDTYRIKEFIEQNRPKSAVIIGAGYIGIEMAENLKEAGLAVTVIEKANQVIAQLDYDMACELHSYIRSKGINLLLGTALEETDIQADMYIMAVGVKPETGFVKDSGIELSERGAILVNENMQTSDPDIYAAGDAVEVVDFITGKKALIPLAGPANKQGRIAADNICGIVSKYSGTQGSSVLKIFDMTVATTGINEKTAQRAGLNYEKSFTYSASHAGYYPGASNIAVKLLFEKETGKILGAQLSGFEGTDKRCDVIATAIRFNATVYDLTKLELCYAPPYSSAKDPVNMAGYVAENILTGKVKIYHWDSVKVIQESDDVIRLDVRTAIEYNNGHIEGFINIPLDTLRERLGELDKSKTVYVHCQTGLRSYVACRILTQKGFDCYNLSGGYRLYRTIFKGAENMNNSNVNTQTQNFEAANTEVIKIDACGLQCPGPIVRLSAVLKERKDGEVVEISTTDPAFASDIEGFCRRTGNQFLDSHSEKGVSVVKIRKGTYAENACNISSQNGKNFIVFSGDLDKAIASFIMANAAAALGRKVSMFFTFWGLNILRKPEKVKVKKDLISNMFGSMMPRGSKKLSLSKMNMGGMGAKMIRGVMKKKNIDSLEDLIRLAQSNGVELIACSMSMDVMGIKPEELIDGVKLGGAAAMLAHAEESDMSLFI